MSNKLQLVLSKYERVFTKDNVSYWLAEEFPDDHWLNVNKDTSGHRVLERYAYIQGNSKCDLLFV